MYKYNYIIQNATSIASYFFYNNYFVSNIIGLMIVKFLKLSKQNSVHNYSS